MAIWTRKTSLESHKFNLSTFILYRDKVPLPLIMFARFHNLQQELLTWPSSCIILAWWYRCSDTIAKHHDQSREKPGWKKSCFTLNKEYKPLTSSWPLSNTRNYKQNWYTSKKSMTCYLPHWQMHKKHFHTSIGSTSCSTDSKRFETTAGK